MPLILKIGVIIIDCLLFIFYMKEKKKSEKSESEAISDEYDSQSEYSTSELDNISSSYYFDV